MALICLTMWGSLTPSREVCCSATLDNMGQPCDSLPSDSGCMLLGSERREGLEFNFTPSREECFSYMLDNLGQPCDSLPGDSGCVLLGSE